MSALVWHAIRGRSMWPLGPPLQAGVAPSSRAAAVQNALRKAAGSPERVAPAARTRRKPHSTATKATTKTRAQRTALPVPPMTFASPTAPPFVEAGDCEADTGFEAGAAGASSKKRHEARHQT